MMFPPLHMSDIRCKCYTGVAMTSKSHCLMAQWTNRRFKVSVSAVKRLYNCFMNKNKIALKFVIFYMKYETEIWKLTWNYMCDHISLEACSQCPSRLHSTKLNQLNWLSQVRHSETLWKVGWTETCQFLSVAEFQTVLEFLQLVA